MSSGSNGEQFPADFLWGAATSAYQIEGSPLADGAGPSNWHRFSHQPGKTHDGDTGDVACDHYRRWADDIALMTQLGLQSYRFSISWARIFPDGTGAVNAAGLDFYDKLIDGLLAAGIRPNATLYHWDLPAALDDLGGWTNPAAPDWFADYARAVFERLGDRVDLWSTFNEPWVSVHEGYVNGTHAPGHCDLKEAGLVSANLLRAHGKAVRVYRSLPAKLRAEGRGQIGIVLNLEPKDAASDEPVDLAATVRADAYMNRQFLDPLFRGKFPAELSEFYGANTPKLDADDWALLADSVDFLGINYYSRGVTRNDPDNPPLRASTVRQPDSVYTELNWEVHPESLTRLLIKLKKTCGDLPLYITENGAAFNDPEPDDKGRIGDIQRQHYFRDHLLAVRHAIAAGVNVRGYYAWSLFDNFEWAFGYAKRFGIIAVDYANQKRTLKNSAHYYQKVIVGNGQILDESEVKP